MRVRPIRADGFSLTEVALALAIMAFCMVAIFGLLPVGFNSNQSAIQQTAAVDILTAVSADLRSTIKTDLASPRFAIPIPAGTTLYFKDNLVVGTATDSRYRVNVTFTAPSAGNRTATGGRVLISWPAQQADTQKASGSLETFIALDRN